MPFRIELKGVHYAYAGEGTILHDVGFSAAPGDVVGIVAPVGGGKSTLLKLAAGLIRPTRGELHVDGKNFWGLTVEEHYALRSRMGFDFQEAALIVNMTVFANLALPLRYHGGKSEREIAEAVDGWLARFELAPYRDHLPAALSAGLRRRVSCIRALLLGRDFFFWDEPTQGASPSFVEFVVGTIGENRRRGIGAMVTTQNAAFLSRVADRVVVVEGGKVRYCGPLEGGRIPVAIAGEGMLRE